MEQNIIEVKNLRKVYQPGNFEAVKSISFSVKEGEIFGFLGPNGAGKTTTLNMLSTLLFPTSGTALIAGYDINKNPDLVRKNIGMVFQDTSLDIDLTGRENLELHAIMYGLDKETRVKRITEMMETVGLSDKANFLVKNYSGGMKRRLEIARGLLHYPKCLFLDEPTIGLDPQTRRIIWDYIKKLNGEYDITIILTSHYMEEADELCDRICIIDHGEIIALDTNENLKKQLQGDVISIEFENYTTLMQYKDKIQAFPGIHAIKIVLPKKILKSFSNKYQMPVGPDNIPIEHSALPPEATKLNVTIANGSEKVPDLVKIAADAGIKIKSLTISQPSLENVFIHYTGRTIREEEGEGRIELIRHYLQRQTRIP